MCETAGWTANSLCVAASLRKGLFLIKNCGEGKRKSHDKDNKENELLTSRRGMALKKRAQVLLWTEKQIEKYSYLLFYKHILKNKFNLLRHFFDITKIYRFFIIY